jgi:hypothetical protein
VGRLAGTDARQALEEWGKGRLFKAAVGQSKKAFSQVENKGLMDDAENYLASKMQIGVGDSVESIAEKLAARRDLVGSQLDDMLAKLDEAGPSISQNDVARRIREDVLPGIDPVAQKNVLASIGDVASDYDKTQIGPSGPRLLFSEAAKMRAAAQKNAAYDAAVPRPIADAWAKVARVWNDVIDEKAAPLLESAGLE